MLLFYYSLVVLVYIIALPVLIILCFKQKYKISIPSRFFLKNNSAFKNEGIWFHACSLGEVNSLKPIFKELKEENINLSVITGTGYKAAKEIEGLHVRFLPFELFLPFWINKQKTLVVCEAELWPMLFIVSKLKGIKTILINARVSDNSYNSYKKFSWFYKWIFGSIDEVFAQSGIDKERLEELGAKKVKVNGNIKTFSKPVVTKEYIKPRKKVIVVASSHESEEQMICENLKLKDDEMLIVVPRHPERFASVDKLLQHFTKEKKLTYSKLSVGDDLNKNVVLCDKMGELVNLLAISDIVILCGSFIDGIGGHNPLEPAFFGKKIISGPYTFNQKALFSLVENIKVCSIDELKDINFDGLQASKVLHVGNINFLIKEIKNK
nr:lipid IV(A) 3-deoxy-D-manno-octulosonic acid transferase [Sulfurospirillum arcachonense]